MFQAKTQDQEIREKPLSPFDYLPLVTNLHSNDQDDKEKVLRIVETLKHNRKKLYDKKC